MALLEERTQEAPVADFGILRAAQIGRRSRRGPVLEMRSLLAAAAAAGRTEAAGVRASRAAAQQTSCQVKSSTWSGHEDATQGCSAWNENALSGCCCCRTEVAGGIVNGPAAQQRQQALSDGIA